MGCSESETDEVGIEKVSYPTQNLIFACADAFAFKMNESLKIEIFWFENGQKMKSNFGKGQISAPMPIISFRQREKV